MMWLDHGQSTDSYYKVRPEIDDTPKTKFRIKAGKTLSVRKWHAAFSTEGQLDFTRTLSRIHRGGIHPSIRGEVWEFLLGCYDPNTTFDERTELQQRRRLKYAQWKEDCRQMFPVIGSGRFITAPIINDKGEPILDPLVLLEANMGNGTASGSAGEQTEHSDITLTLDKSPITPMSPKEIQWKLHLHQIGLDVKRTDRALMFYEKQENLSKLWDILSVYAWIDEDVGYCQGMSDLCSPMIILLDNEADAFWCFERLMRRLSKSKSTDQEDLSSHFKYLGTRVQFLINFVSIEMFKRGNFRATGRSIGVEAQLSNLAAITQVVDPKLHQHLETLGGGDYLFAIRMLMVLFRREFSFGDSLYLWEMMWALEYDPELFYVYEDSDSAIENGDGSKGRKKSMRHYGKFERENLKSGVKEGAPLPISVFLVVSVLKDKSPKLLKEARGLDDVVKILNDIAGDLDARKACVNAMKLHKKYLRLQAKKI